MFIVTANVQRNLPLEWEASICVTLLNKQTPVSDSLLFFFFWSQPACRCISLISSGWESRLDIIPVKYPLQSAWFLQALTVRAPAQKILCPAQVEALHFPHLTFVNCSFVRNPFIHPVICSFLLCCSALSLPLSGSHSSIPAYLSRGNFAECFPSLSWQVVGSRAHCPQLEQR